MSEIRRAYDLLRGYINHEWDRIRSSDLESAWQELQETPKTEASQIVEPNTTLEEKDLKEIARTILGVNADASFSEIKKSFDRLNKRSNPSNFPENSAEAANALKIQTRVNWAFRILCEDMPDSEKRFQSLEFD